MTDDDRKPPPSEGSAADRILPASDGEETYSLGEATVPPKWGGGQSAAKAAAAADPSELRLPPRTAVAVAEDDSIDEEDDSPSARSSAGRPTKPRLRDWLEARCKREAQMYALGAAVMAPIGLGAVGLTWLVLYFVTSYYGAFIGPLFATALVAALFWVNRQAGDQRSIRVNVDPADRDIKPVAINVPRGSGLTWMMYLTGSRDLPGILQFVGAITLFGPRLCDLALQMGRTAQKLWTTDVDSLAGPLRTLVRAEGKVSFAAFFERHSRLAPQQLVRRLSRIDGVLFLPNSEPPGLCVSNAMKDEFAAWRAQWQQRRSAATDDRLYD